MTMLGRFTAPLIDLDVSYVYDDFTADQSDTFFIDTASDGGAMTVGDTRKGLAVLTASDGSVGDNDESYLESANELFIFTAGKPIYGRCLMQYSEANTDDANVAFGFQNAVGADSIIDDGGGVKTSGSTVAIYKVDGGTVWKCVSACNGVATTSTSTTTAGGSSYQLLEIEILDFDSTNMQCLFKVDKVYLKDSNGIVIKHFVPIANATEMAVWAGVKNGDTNLETLNVDYVYAHQMR